MRKHINKPLILAIFGVVLTGAALFTTIFAWFAFVKTDQSIIFTTGKVEVLADLYQANDLDFDGIFDESDYELKTGPITINNVVSGQRYSFKLVIKNVGTIPGKLTVTLSHTGVETLNKAYTLHYSNLDETNYSHTETSFPEGEFVVAEMASLTNISNENETVLLFQIFVNKNLTNAQHSQPFIISKITIDLEQIPRN